MATAAVSLFCRQPLLLFFMFYASRMTVGVWGFCHIAHSTTERRFFRYSSVRFLNRFLFDNSEAMNDSEMDSIPTVLLPKDDFRTVHAAKILGLKNGDTIRAGIVSSEANDGLWTDEATIEWIPEGKVKKPEVLKNGNPPGSLSVQLKKLAPPDGASDQILVSLILALPRPLQLGRMLPMISQMGVDQLILTDAKKVPKEYFGSHLFRKPEKLQDLLIEGLCQAGDVRVPKVRVVRNLGRFLEQDLDMLFPPDEYARAIAHPRRLTDTREPLRLGQIEFPSISPPRIVLAVGPEGGWEEPLELDMFQRHGFQQCTLGKRILRSDCAVVSLLGLAHEVCYDRGHSKI
eukprot:scaffold26_cov117-Cylindrotheca_fusiformis.AAC.18